jgi:hypothetical protein
MTQSPYGGTASPSVQSGPGGRIPSGTDNGANGGPGRGPTAEFGATTISSTQQHPVADREHAPQPGPTAGEQPRRPQAAPQSGRAGRNRGPRRARLQLRHISPLTVLKFSCVLAIALFFVWLIVVGVLYGVLDAAGVIGHVNDTIVQLNGTGSKPPITAGIVFGGAAIIGVVNIVLFVALMTIGSVIYNLCADLVGGIEITLSER